MEFLYVKDNQSGKQKKCFKSFRGNKKTAKTATMILGYRIVTLPN